MLKTAEPVLLSLRPFAQRPAGIPLDTNESAGRADLAEDPSLEPSDGSLLRRFRTGEQEAATRLYLRYAHRLHGLAIAQTGQDLKARIDPEDIVQSVFRTFFRRAQDGHYEVPNGEELWKLFLVIGLHKIRDAAVFHRAAKRTVARTSTLTGHEHAFESASADHVAESTLKMVIDELLQRLNDTQKEIIMMRLEGTQVEEIAARTQRSHRTIERTLQKFRQLLHEQIHDKPEMKDGSE